MVGLVDDDQTGRQGKGLNNGALRIVRAAPVPTDAQPAAKLAQRVHVGFGPGGGGVDNLPGILGSNITGRVSLAAARGATTSTSLCSSCAIRAAATASEAIRI